MSTILIIDDDRALCRSLEIQLRFHDHDVRLAYGAEEGYALARKLAPDLLLLDINLPGQDGLSALPDFLRLNPETPVIIMTAEPGNQLVVEAMRNGAVDYLKKPFALEKVLHVLDTFARNRQRSALTIPEENGGSPDGAPPEMIGAHPSMLVIHKTIGLLSRSRVTILIRGESGTGKELAARILHEASTPGEPFVGVNCSAVVPSLLENEFFGHEKGAFTGADRVKLGKLEHAAGGTVFLDEIGDMPLELQGKLLRVLQEGEFVRVGGLQPIQLAARIIAATHRDLEQMVQTGAFRKDLFYRLSVAALDIPPLRERRADIPLLVEFLLRKIRRKLQCQVSSISKEALDFLAGCDWPGNVRELENILTRAVALAKSSMLNSEDLEFPMQAAQNDAATAQALSLAVAEKQHIEKILAINKWNITHAARMLAISPTTLRKKIADFHLKEIR